MGILGLDIGGTNIRIGYVQNDSIEQIESFRITRGCNEAELLNDLFTTIEKFNFGNIEGIGIGVPSVVDVEKGIVYDVQNIPSWKEVHLKDLLENKYNIPVYINNDANCFAAGEKYFGKMKEYKNIVGLIIGTGLGAGIIINGKLYAGNNCGAGEFGAIPFLEHDYEYYCSGQFFKNKYNITGEECFMKASASDKTALEIFAEYGSNLGEALKLVLYTIDPEVIVLGGSVSKSFPFFEKAMRNSMQSFLYPKSISKIKIEVSELSNVAILGAAALYLDASQ